VPIKGERLGNRRDVDRTSKGRDFSLKDRVRAISPGGGSPLRGEHLV